MNNQQIERRAYPAMRAHVERMLADGWVITCRNPVSIERGPLAQVLRKGVLIDG